jgi:hypothetical protein
MRLANRTVRVKLSDCKSLDEEFACSNPVNPNIGKPSLNDDRATESTPASDGFAA